MNTRLLIFKPLLAALFVLLLATASQAQMQPFNPGTPEILVDGDASWFMSPVWSPDGRHIAFTSAEYRGIWTVPAEGGTPRQITDEDAAGFGFSWSSDGSAIAARPARFDAHSRHNAIKVYEVETGSERTLIDYRRGQMSLPRWTDLDQRLAVQVQREVEIVETGMEPVRREKQMRDEAVLVPRNNRIEKIMLSADTPVVVEDFGDRNILNLVPSPDGSAIAVQIMGEGIYVIDADGSNLCEIGRAENPVWSPEGRYLIAMITEDDGHNITGSELYAIDITTSRRFHLTAHTDVIALHPTVSPDGRRVAFGDPNTGRIYTMTIR
jgi:Tol biopolymer transport system component